MRQLWVDRDAADPEESRIIQVPPGSQQRLFIESDR